MKKLPATNDVNTREYWERAVADPVAHQLTDRQAQAMRDSLDLTDPQYWKKVLAHPKNYGFNLKQAQHLADHFLKPRSAGVLSTPLEQIEAEAGLHMGFYGEKFVRTWLEIPVVSPRDAALLLHSKNPSKHKAELPDFGDAFDLMMVWFEGVARDGRDRNLLDWISVAQEHGLTAVDIAGWNACGAVFLAQRAVVAPAVAPSVEGPEPDTRVEPAEAELAPPRRVDPVEIVSAPVWAINKSQDDVFQSYGAAIYTTLKSALDKGKRHPPKPMDIVDEWRRSPPHPITSVDDGIVSYENASGIVKKISDTEVARLA